MSSWQYCFTFRRTDNQPRANTTVVKRYSSFLITICLLLINITTKFQHIGVSSVCELFSECFKMSVDNFDPHSRSRIEVQPRTNIRPYRNKKTSSWLLKQLWTVNIPIKHSTQQLTILLIYIILSRVLMFIRSTISSWWRALIFFWYSDSVSAPRQRAASYHNFSINFTKQQSIF